MTEAHCPTLPLPPYSGVYALCVKCGRYGAPTSRYVEQGLLLAKADAAAVTGIAPEYQERICRNCGYKWAEDIAR